MHVYLDYAMERMGTWDLEEIETTIGEVGIRDSAGIEIDDGTGMEVDGVENVGEATANNGYTVNISHKSGDQPCGKDTVLTNKQFHQAVLNARKSHGV